MRFFAFLAVLVLAGVSQAGGHVSRSLAVYSAPQVQADVCVHDGDVVPGVNAQAAVYAAPAAQAVRVQRVFVQRQAAVYAAPQVQQQVIVQRQAAVHHVPAVQAQVVVQRQAFVRRAPAVQSQVIIQRDVVAPQRVDVIQRRGLFGLGILPINRTTVITR